MLAVLPGPRRGRPRASPSAIHLHRPKTSLEHPARTADDATHRHAKTNAKRLSAHTSVILAEIQARLEIVAEPIEEGPAVAASPAYIPNHILPLVTESEPVAPVEMRGKDIFLVQGDRRYRILCAGRAELLRANSPQQAGPYRLLHPGVQRAQVVGAD